MDKRIGLVAGNNSLPIVAAQQARKAGVKVYACAIKGETDPVLEGCVDAITWVKVGQLGHVVDFFKKNNVAECLFAGKITKTNILKGEVIPDLDMIRAMTRIHDWKDDSLLGAICGYLASKGITVIDSTTYLSDQLVREKVYTKRMPGKAQIEDVEFGWHLAKEMGRLDIGQTVVVKNKAVIAVEAIEGTDAAIRRGGELGGKGCVVVKVSKPRQDMRFDVPVIGMKTLEALIEAEVKVLAVEAGKTILLDEPLLVDRMNREQMVLVGKKEL